MAQIPISVRSIPLSTKAETQRTFGEKLSVLGSWFLLVIALVLCGMGGWGIFDRLLNAPVAQIIVTGEITATEKRLLQQKIQPLMHENYFTADLVSIRDAALSLTWVESVTVTRHWPDGLLVRVIPRQPVARWGSGRLLSGQGVVFVEASRADHADLPLLHGPEAQSLAMMKQYQQINQWFAPLGLRLSELYLTDRMTWFMAFDSGMRVIVDQEQTNLKLQRLSELGQGNDRLHQLWQRVAAV
ncbi:MAG: FtsQ-type POTRA domain-containing protein, partial [Candidatus Saccharibacteria bacterium]|nr:FtsQ-type POTRA domain-containing protein [Moraxellaceae bacterium]